MGLCLDNTDEPRLENFSVEVRRESFYLHDGHIDSSIELLIADIPKIRLALDLVEKHKR